jgi:hypothetical protein
MTAVESYKRRFSFAFKPIFQLFYFYTYMTALHFPHSYYKTHNPSRFIVFSPWSVKKLGATRKAC